MQTGSNTKNFIYLLGHLWEYDKKILLRFIECVLLGSLIPYIAITMPKIVLQLLLEHATL